MPKNNFLLVDLNETKTKKLAETITSSTSRKILNHLTEKDDSEANIAKSLGIPISTVHYHLQKLQEAGLVVVEEFHYSKKGREVNHYKLANKYIIIAPKKVTGLKEKLRGILPVGIIVLGIGAVIQWVQRSGIMSKAAPAVMEAASLDVDQEVAQAVRATAEESFVSSTASAASYTPPPAEPSIALWFVVGALTTIALFILFQWIKNRKK